MTERETSIKNNLLSHFPGSVNKTGKVFNAIIDSMINSYTNAENFAKAHYETTNYQNFDDELMKTFTSFFGLPEMNNFTPAENKARFKLLFNRDTDKWGTIFDFTSILKKYYKLNNVYIAENVSDENLLIDGDFENQSTTAWRFSTSGKAYITNEANFEGAYGLKLEKLNNVRGSATQEIYLEAGVYVLSCFCKGSFVIYVNDTLKNIYTVSGSTKKDVWEYKIFKIKITTPFTHRIIIEGSDLCVDYVRLCRNKYPCFSVIANFQGGSSGEVLFMQPETISSTDNLKFMDHSYFPAQNSTKYVNKALNLLLDYIRPVGVKAYGVTLIKYSGEQEDYVLEQVLYTFSGSVEDGSYNTTNNKSVSDGVYNT